MYHNQKQRILERLHDICIDVALEQSKPTDTGADIQKSASDLKNLTLKQLIELVESL